MERNQVDDEDISSPRRHLHHKTRYTQKTQQNTAIFCLTVLYQDSHVRNRYSELEFNDELPLTEN